ncbi:MAG: hypothetical protein WAN93_14295 [Solirubrobacteraceae bacterium]
MHLRRPSFTGIIASVALFVALGGSAAAAGHYLITSTSQIKPSILQKLKGNVGPKGVAGQAGATGATGATGAAGARGATGAQGAPGQAGPGALSTLISVTSPEVEVLAGEINGASAFCPAGYHAVGGGGYGSIAGIDVSEMGTGHESWFIIISNKTSITLKITAEAQCAGTGQAIAASLPRATQTRAVQQVDHLVAKLTAESNASK